MARLRSLFPILCFGDIALLFLTGKREADKKRTPECINDSSR
jgi:hypothetical protein